MWWKVLRLTALRLPAVLKAAQLEVKLRQLQVEHTLLADLFLQQKNRPASRNSCQCGQAEMGVAGIRHYFQLQSTPRIYHGIMAI